MAERSAESTPLPSAKVVARGIQGFILFSLVGTILGMWWKRPAGLESLANQSNWQFGLLLLPLVALDFFLGGLRYRLFFDGKVLPCVSLWNCMRSNWANIFMGAATPFQAGGGTAQVYILWRCGATVADGMLASLVNFAATLIFFLIGSFASVLLLPTDLFGENFGPIFLVVGGLTGLKAALVLLVLLFPKLGLRMVKGFLELLPLRCAKFLMLRDRMLNKLAVETQRFGDGFKKILQQKKIALVVTVVATLVLFFNKYLMGYVIARALGQSVPFGIFIGLQIIQLFLLYFAPTPGGSGVAELSSVWLMGKLMPESLLLVYAVLWRFATTMLGAVIGGVILMLDMRRWMQKDALVPHAAPVPVLAPAKEGAHGERVQYKTQ
ncbi:flippase-like domain-containing protein [candidate division KSB1 bacterium]|nr:flippase-like domain-containing protein [candidate division KSB1 bacterium]